MIGLIAATANGRRNAAHLADVWPEACFYEGRAKEALQKAWNECDGIVLFLATGAADPLMVECRGACLILLLRLRGVELVREREPRTALASEIGAPTAPHRERSSKHSPLPALLAQQHHVPAKTFRLRRRDGRR